MTKEELIKLYNEITLSTIYTVEEKIAATNDILKEIEKERGTKWN